MLNTQPGVLGLPTMLGILVVLVTGAILVLTNHLEWGQYEKDAAILIGLLGIGHGIDAHSRP